MLKTFLSDLRQFTRKLQVRIILIAALSPIAVIFAKFIAPLIPYDLTRWIGADAVDPIVQILANSMLAVTIFALTMMTAAFRAVSSQWTPRAHLVMMEDTVTQNVLATFLGSWLFALTAIILRASEVFGDNEKVVLFAFTIIVVALVVFAMTRWILHLETLGSLIETSERLEERATKEVCDYAEAAGEGAHVLRDGGDEIPAGAMALLAGSTGYVQGYDAKSLNEHACEAGLRVYITAPVGRFVFAGDPLAQVTRDDGGAPEAEALEGLEGHIRLGRLRSFDGDPRFGVLALSEIATRALSPGINDPGTAIDILHRLGRVLSYYRPETRGEKDVEYDRLWVPALDVDAMFRDGFDPVARSAAGTTEVHVVLQQVLSGLARRDDPVLAQAARRASLSALPWAEAGIEMARDLARVRAAMPEGLQAQPADEGEA